VTAPISVVIIAGGKSRRLGIDKRKLLLANGRTLLEETVARLTRLSDDIAVVAGFGEVLTSIQGARIYSDQVDNAGPLAGLAVGLSVVRHEFALVVAVDLPFLDLTLLRWLIAQPRDYDLLLPRHRDGRCEPLQAIYRTTCLPVIQNRLRLGQLKLLDLTVELRVHFVDEVDDVACGPDAFFNLNTPEDLQRVRPLLACTHGLDWYNLCQLCYRPDQPGN
jgi:molybdopterin-guanine dinucleotide biosynthesis protein A